MSCARSRAELPGRSPAVHGRPSLLAPIVTQLVTQGGCQTLKRNIDGFSPGLRQPGRRAGHGCLWAHVVCGWLLTFHSVLCPVCAPGGSAAGLASRRGLEP